MIPEVGRMSRAKKSKANAKPKQLRKSDFWETQAGAFRADSNLTNIVRNTYRRRGRPITDAGPLRNAHDRIDESLTAALDSGPSTPMTAADLDRIRREGRKRIAAKKRKRI
jgi:hypothetical protein